MIDLSKAYIVESTYDERHNAIVLNFRGRPLQLVRIKDGFVVGSYKNVVDAFEQLKLLPDAALVGCALGWAPE